MITYRQRGLVNVYVFFTGFVAVFLLNAYSLLLDCVDLITLAEGVNLLPYYLAVFLGVISSLGNVQARGYTLHVMGAFDSFTLALRQVFYVSACIFCLMFATKDRDVSRLFLGSYLIILWFMLAWLHTTLPRLLARMFFGQTARLPTLFIGTSVDLTNLDDWISNRGHLGIRPVGFLADERPTRVDSAIAPYIGRIENLRESIQAFGVRKVVLLQWIADSEKLERIIADCEAEGCRFLIHNNLDPRFSRPLIPIQEGGRHFLALQEEPLEDPINRVLKRTLDIFISFPVVFFILPPLCTLVWVVQRFQAPGPLFFVKPRGGKNHLKFNMLKFRSMYAADHNINKQATSNDSRIYPLGRFLRKTSLDEFPQFFNVLMGQMSIVGPRPHLPQHDIEFSEISRPYRVRFLVKPGITGLAQVSGFRGEITEPEKLHRRVYWDLFYVTNWSLSLDIRIILRTGWQVFFPPPEAY